MTPGAEPPDPILTAAEVARRLGIEVRHVQRLHEKGLPYLDLGERTRRYRWSDVERWLDQRRRMADAQ